MLDSIQAAAQALAQETIETRRDFHRHPEIAFEEHRTAKVIAERLEALGLKPQTGIGKTGVIAVLDTGKPGKTVLARADIDALPVQEENEHEYASQIEGKMHACGHDGHTAILLSVAKILVDKKDEFSGKIIFVFQPAEEGAGGAQAMIEDGALEGLNVDHSIGLHLGSMIPTGVVAMRCGPAMASADKFVINISGKGGHAAMPQHSVDPILISSHVVTALQSLVSRELDPTDQAVISVTSIHGGTAFNIIPESVELMGTVRTFNEETRQYIAKRIQEVVDGVCSSLRGSAEVDFMFGTPTVINDNKTTERLKTTFAKSLNEGQLIEAPQIMGGDDMAHWLNAADGCYFFVGAGNEEKGTNYPHHHPKFDIDEDSLPLAVEMLTKGVLELLS